MKRTGGHIAACVLSMFIPMAVLFAAPPVLKLGIDASDLGTGDPHYAAQRNDRLLADMVFNGLLRYAPGNSPSVEPDLAVAIPEPVIVGDEQVWRFTLRRGVMCHAGPNTPAYELTAADVVYSLRKSADPERSAYAGEYTNTSVRMIDDYTIEVIEKKPLSSILFFAKIVDYAGGFIVCRKAYEAMGEEAFRTHPVGTGPFKFKEYVPKSHVLLEANTSYLRGEPLLGGVEIVYVPDLKARTDALQRGNLDLAFGSERPEWLSTMQKSNEFVVDLFGPGQVTTLHLNTAMEPLDDIRVREAILHQLDRDTFLGLFAKGVGENVYSPVPVQFLPGGLTRAEVKALGLARDYDPILARARLREAGHEGGFSLKVLTSERGDYRRNYESIRDQLASLGIKVQVEVVEHRAMHKAIRADKNPMVIYIAWRPNADVFLTRFFHSDSIVVTGVKPDTNFSHYAKIDKLIEAARLTREPNTQVSLWKQAQIQILKDAVALPLHYTNLVYARWRHVDYGHDIKSSVSLYPQITEKTRILQ